MGQVAKPVALVTVKECRSESPGFRNYLGRRFNKGTNSWEELYGKKLLLSLELTLYAPGELGGNGCQSLFAQISAALQEEPEGIRVSAFSRGETTYQKEFGLMCCPTELECTAYLYAVADEEGEFLSFEVKGVTK
jgi:hypothetical protein